MQLYWYHCTNNIRLTPLSATLSPCLLSFLTSLISYYFRGREFGSKIQLVDTKTSHSQEKFGYKRSSLSLMFLLHGVSQSVNTYTKFFSTSEFPCSGNCMQAETVTKAESRYYCPLLYYSVQSGKYQPYVGSCSIHIFKVDVISYPQETEILYRFPSEPKTSHGLVNLFSE